MGYAEYSVKVGEKNACAQAHDVNASYKDLTQVCGAIKGKSIGKAKRLLKEAAALKRAIPYKKFNTGCGHRPELGGRKGRYPKKECFIMLRLLDNAAANAVHKGLDSEKVFVKTARAYKQASFPRYRRTWAGSVTLGYGKRAVWKSYETARIEIVLEEKARPPARKTKPAKPGKPGPEPAKPEKQKTSKAKAEPSEAKPAGAKQGQEEREPAKPVKQEEKQEEKAEKTEQVEEKKDSIEVFG